MSGISSGYQKESTTGVEGSQSGAKTNAAINNSNADATTAQEVAGTLPSDFRLSNTVFDPKGNDNTVPNEVDDAPGEGLRSFGGGGDLKKPGDYQSHEIDLPKSNEHAGAGFIQRTADPKNNAQGIS